MYHTPAPEAGPVLVMPDSTVINGWGHYSGGLNTILLVISVSTIKTHSSNLHIEKAYRIGGYTGSCFHGYLRSVLFYYYGSSYLNPSLYSLFYLSFCFLSYGAPILLPTYT